MDFNTGSSGERPDDQSRPQYGGGARGPAPGPAGGPGGEFSLQDPIASFISTVRGVVLDPVGFFRGMPRRGDVINPIVFALICYEIFTIVGGIIGLFFSGFTSLADPSASQGAGFLGSVGGFLVSLILAPIFAGITLFVLAGVFHLLTLLIIGTTNAGFEAK